MKTRQQVTAEGDFLAGTWAAELESAWRSLRRECARIAADRDLKLTEDESADMRTLLYVKAAGDPNDGARRAECSRGEAEFIRLRLSAWAEPK